MAISDYNSLAAEIKAWAARSDPAFSNRIETFIAFTEQRIYNGQGEPGDALYCPALNAPEMETDWIVTFTNGVADVPGDMSTMRTIRRAGDDVGLDYLPTKQFWIRDAEANTTLNPAYYTIEQGKIYVTPSYSGDLQILYYKKFDAISSDNPTGTLITKYPLLYLSGCLFEAFSFMQEADLAMGHWARHKSQIAGINASADSVRFGGGPLKVRVRNALP